MRRAIAAALLAALVMAPAAHARSAPNRALSFLHVGAAGGPAALPQVLDSRGRSVLLKGVNADGIVDYWRPDLRTPYPIDPAAYANGACPPDDPTIEGVRLCEFDFAQMRPLGYDAVRLNLSWSLLEPQPGQIDQQYVDRIAQVVGWAKRQGIYVVLDMHEDAWSKYLYTPPGQVCPPPAQAIRGFDGAPEWASRHTSPVCAVNGVRELDPAVAEDSQKLWNDAAGPDGKGLQEHYAGAMTALARRFKDEPAVAGYEIINEPHPGFNAAPVEFDQTQLFPFYGKVVNSVVANVPGFHQLFFVEPDAVRNVTDARSIYASWSSYSSYPNVVYAPHVYTGVFTADALSGGPHTFKMEDGYRNAIGDAKSLGTPLWVGEFGNNPSDDDDLLRQHYELQDKYGVPGALWLWKENANDTNPQFFWGVYGPPFGSGTPQPKRIAYTSRAYPLFLDGDLRSMSYRPGSGDFAVSAAGARAVRCGDRAHATLLFVPAAYGGAVAASGAQLEQFARGGGAREVYVYPSGSHYSVHSAARPGAMCPRAAARRRAARHHSHRRGSRRPGARFTG